LGKTEQFKHNLSAWYSRRITNEYRVVDDSIEIISLKYHY